ncbi:MAG: glycosyltransferase [Opitutae bacterium]|nr:glycosyltransferase [Opitutae bacterium]
MSTAPSISAITVCRNAAGTIAATAESLARQTWRDFEWIVVDGASSDDTLVRLAPWRTQIAQLVSEPDLGIYDAMNKGLRLARGRYVYFLNADDTLAAPDVFARIAASFVAGDWRLIHGNVILWSPGSPVRQRIGRPWQRHDALRCALPHHQGAFLAREWAVAAGGFVLRFGWAADVHLLGCALRDPARCRWVDVDVAEFRADGATRRAGLSWRALGDRAAAVQAAFGWKTGLLHRAFLAYYWPKMLALEAVRGTRLDRLWRERRMRRQGL